MWNCVVNDNFLNPFATETQKILDEGFDMNEINFFLSAFKLKFAAFESYNTLHS